MKKLAIVAGAALMIAASCNNAGDTTATPGVQKADSNTTTCNIRYINVDSVLSAYTLAQELIAEQQKEVANVERAARQKESELQRMESQIANKVQSNGYLTEESYKADVMGLQQRQQEAGQWLNTHQERLAKLMTEQQIRLNDSLQNFLRDYNAVYKYDAILDKKSGFFKEELDITAEVIQGLNERYVPATPTK